MNKQRSFLTQLLGTTTKVRIIEKLVIEPGMCSRHELYKKILGGIGPTYQQIDQLIALGIVKETKGKIELDPTFPFYDDIANLIISTTEYLNDHRILLDRINILFGTEYYITGYIAACQNGPPIDHEQNSVLIAILNLDQNNRWSNYLKTLAEVSSIKMAWFNVKSIPVDGVFLAEHHDRRSCGKCGYTEFKRKKKDEAPAKAEDEE